MALSFEPRGDLASAKNVKATSVKTWPVQELGKKSPMENNGGGSQMAKRGESGGKPKN
jgi:hypothetical protein